MSQDFQKNPQKLAACNLTTCFSCLVDRKAMKRLQDQFSIKCLWATRDVLIGSIIIIKPYFSLVKKVTR